MWSIRDGSQVFKYAVRAHGGGWPGVFLERNGFTSDDLALVVPHQANLRIIRAMQERLGVDDSKGHGEHRQVRQHHRRNDSAGACATRWTRGPPFEKGDLVLLAAGRRRLYHPAGLADALGPFSQHFY